MSKLLTQFKGGMSFEAFQNDFYNIIVPNIVRSAFGRDSNETYFCRLYLNGNVYEDCCMGSSPYNDGQEIKLFSLSGFVFNDDEWHWLDENQWKYDGEDGVYDDEHIIDMLIDKYCEEYDEDGLQKLFHEIFHQAFLSDR